MASIIGHIVRCSCFAAGIAAGGLAAAGELNVTKPALREAELSLTLTASAATDAIQRPPIRDGAALVLAQVEDIERRLPRKETGEDQPGKPSITISQPPPLRDSAAAPFVLTGVTISGATVFPPEAFAPVYDKYLARAVSTTDIAKLIDEITAMYRREGYFLSRALAPAQDVSGSVLRIEIAEGYIERILVKGDASSSIQRRLTTLTKERPLRLASLERRLALLGDLPGVKVASVSIEPDLGDHARHMLVVKADVDPFEASVYIDNRGTPQAGQTQTYARVAVNSVVKTGDQLSFGVFTVPDDPEELILGEAAYRTPIGNTPAYITLSGMVARFDAGASLAAFDTESKTERVTASVSYPFIRGKDESLFANISFEFRDIREEQLGVMQFEDKLRMVRASANYWRNYWNGTTSLFAEVSRGFDVLDASDGGGSLSRPDADGQFTKIEGRISRYQNIGQVFGLYAAAAGQYSSDPLLASEEFAIGGAQYGRAYNYSEISGDDAVAAIVELRFGRKPKFSLLDFYQFYGFYDVGRAWNDNAAPGFEEITIRSAGGGVRLTLPESIYINVEAAKPLNRTPFTQDDRDWRGFFSFSKSF